MYNEFQKRRYIESPSFRFYEDSTEVVKHMFEGAAKVEAQEGKDLSEFNRPQVVNLLKSYNSRAKSYLRLICNYFSDYYSWCLSEGLVDQTNVINYYDYKITKPIIDEVVPIELIRDKHFIRKDVLEYLDMIHDPVNKFIFYAAFSGVYGNEYEDLRLLRMDDLNKKRKTVQLVSGIMLNVDDLFIELMEKADSASTYYPEGIESVNRARKPDRYVYDESYYVIKNSGTGITNTPVSKAVIMNRFRLMQKQIGNEFINGGNTYKNGLINYVKEQFEKNGISLMDGLYAEIDKSERSFAGGWYKYTNELQQYIKEFGSTMLDRALRSQLKGIIDLYE